MSKAARRLNQKRVSEYWDAKREENDIAKQVAAAALDESERVTGEALTATNSILSITGKLIKELRRAYEIPQMISFTRGVDLDKAEQLIAQHQQKVENAAKSRRVPQMKQDGKEWIYSNVGY